MGVCVFRCNLPHALLSEWLGSLPNKNHYTKLTLEKKMIPLLLLELKHTTFQSQVWCSSNKLSWLPSFNNNDNNEHFSVPHIPTGSPSHGGDVAVYVLDISQPSLPTPFYSVLVSVSVFLALSTVFHSANSPNNSPLFHSVIPVFQIYLFMKISFSADIILCGWLGLKHQLTNKLTVPLILVQGAHIGNIL